MASMADYYTTLQVKPDATASDIKASYRRLAKQYHPDLNRQAGASESMRRLNEAYAVLSEPQKRQAYDAVQRRSAYRIVPGKPRTRVAAEDALLVRWLKEVYDPVTRQIRGILKPFAGQIEELSYDPYDEEYINDFQNYLEDCETAHAKAWAYFTSQPNPNSAARIAEYLYHALNHLRDSLDELHYFCQNYDYSHLHTGQELMSLAEEMYERAGDCVRR